MDIGIKLEQNDKHKISGRKRSNYEKLEKEYQEAQSHWDIYEDKPSWDKMFNLINLAVFNCVNKKLEHILDREEVEGRSLDITITIMNSLLQKKSKGKDWKISKVSSFVHYPCFAIYSEKLKFQDKVLGEDAYTVTDDEGNSTIMEYEDSYMKNGIYYLHRGNI